MLKTLPRRVYGERRRVALVTLLAFLAGYIFYARSGAEVAGLPVPLVTGLIYAGIVGPTALVMSLVVPAARHFIVGIGVARLGLAAFVFAYPAIGVHVLASPLLTATLVVGGGSAVSRVLHGRPVRPKPVGWRARLLAPLGQRAAPAFAPSYPFQARFVGWLDGARPAAA